MNRGDHWNYDSFTSESGAFGAAESLSRRSIEVIEGGRFRDLDDVQQAQARDDSPSEVFFRKGPSGVARLEAFGTDRMLAVPVLLFPTTAGVSFTPLTCTGLPMQQRVSSSPKIDIQMVAAVAGTENLVLAAGAFDAVRVDLRFTTSEGGSWHNRSESSWYAAGVGLVKRLSQSDSSVGGLGFSSSSMQQLSGYDVGGRRGGLTRAASLTPDIMLETTRAAPMGPALSFDGHRHLLAVAQAGFEPSPGIIQTGNSAVGRFVNSDGTFSARFNLSTRLGETIRLAAAFNGAAHLVADAFCPDRSIFDPLYGHCDVLAFQRVSPAGVLLDGPEGFTVTSGGGHVFSPAVASDGAGWLIAYADDSVGLQATRIGADGSVQGTLPLSGLAAATDAAAPALAWGNGSYLVVWLESGRILGRRVSPDGTALDTTAIAISSAATAKELGGVTFDGRSFFVAWSDGRNSADGAFTDVYAARVSSAGTVLDPEGILVDGLQGVAKHEPAVGSDGTSFVVGFRLGDDAISVIRIGANGVPLDSPQSAGHVLSRKLTHLAAPAHPVVVAADGQVLVAWFEALRSVDAAWFAP